MEKALKEFNKIRWEYKVVRLTRSFIQEQLDDIGWDGWELVHIKEGKLDTYTFKRIIT